MDHLQISAADYVCHLRNGIQLEVRGGTDDRHVIFEVFAAQVYPVAVSGEQVVVDIGAHIGCFTALAAERGARVLSFEPLPVNFAVLERNVKRNSIRNALLFQAAVGGKREPRALFLPDDITQTGRSSLQVARGVHCIMVPCLSLADIIRENHLQRIDLLKIDCEGGEYEILFAASMESLEIVQSIVIENESNKHRPRGGHREDLIWHLRAAGFIVESQNSYLYCRRKS
jgi:FkbM family methyltransferase